MTNSSPTNLTVQRVLCLVAGKLGKGLVHFVGDGLVLVLFVGPFVFQSVDLLLQLDHRLLGKLGPVFSLV